MKVEEFHHFLTDKLRSILYKRLKWEEYYMPKSHAESKALIDEFGRLRTIWWMPNVADCAQGKKFAKGQIILALFFTGLSLCCLSKKYRFMSALCLVALSCYIGCSFFSHIRHISYYISIYKGGIMDNYFGVEIAEEAEKYVQENYIESVKGIVSSSEFNMCVSYLLGMKDEGYRDEKDGTYQVGFNDYVSQLRSSCRFKTTLEKSIVEKFLGYVEGKRKDRKGFEQDIKILRYCDEKNGEHDIKEAYIKLFRYTKMLLWHIKPYQPHNVKPIDWFYPRVKHMNGNLSLEKALERLCISHDNPDQVLRELKSLLVVYHPDKNGHENAREIYEKVELVYKAVNTTLKVHERHFGDTIFCNFKMFLGKKLKDIDENSVYEEIMSTYNTLEMKRYLKKKDKIEEIRNDMLEKYRKLIKLEDIILEKKINCPNPKKYRGAEGEKLRLEEEYKNQKEGIQKLSGLKKEIVEGLEELNKKLQIEIEVMSNICSIIKERCSNEIERQSHVLAKSSFDKYYNQKKIDSFKNMLEKLDKEEKGMRTFLRRLKGKNFLNMVRNADIKGLCIPSKDGIQSALHNGYQNVKKQGVGVIKSSCEAARNMHSLNTEYDYIGYYSELHAKYLLVEKEIKSCEVKSGENGKFIFYRKTHERQKDSSDTGMYMITEKTIDFCAKLEDLRSENGRLNKVFKTQQELEKEYKDNLLTTKDMKKKTISTEKRIEQLRSKTEEAEARAEEAEARAEEERRAKEEERRARAKAEKRAETAEAEKKGIELLCDEAYNQKISRKKIKQNEDVHKFLECQYTFLILNVDSTEKFESLCRKYKDLKEEVKKPNFEKLLELTNEFERLSIKFVEREKEEEESRENIPECNEQNIDRLKLSIVTRVIQAREIAERERRTVEKEKFEVEEIIKQLQMQTPDTAFSSMNHEPVAGPSWKK